MIPLNGTRPNCVESNAMASRSKDNIFPKSGTNSGPETASDSGHEPAQEHEPEDRSAVDTGDKVAPGNPDNPEIAPPDSDAVPGASPGVSEDGGRVEDEELLEMLEQLSETIDTAHTVLAEQHDVASGAIQTTPPAPSEFLPPSPPTPPAKRGSALPLLAATAGVLLGVGALTASWLLWKSSPSREAGTPVKLQDRATGTFDSRNPPPTSLTPRGNTEPAKPPEPKAAPEPDSPPAPSPVQAALAPVTEPVPPAEEEPPADEPAAITETPAVSETKPAEVAALPEEKKPELPPLSEEEEMQLLARGKTLTATGDVSSARLAYEYAARRRSVDAMFALAQTYDPEMLAAWSVVGIQPDMNAALEWYGRAAKLGHVRAGTRQRELEQLIGR